MKARKALVLTLLVSLVTTATMTVARAAALSLYLGTNGQPSAGLTEQSPNQGPTTTVTLLPSAAGASETDPARFQQWQRDMSGSTASINNLTIWVSPADADTAPPISFAVWLMDCGGGACALLTSNSKTVQGTSTWTKVTLPVKVASYTFDSGHSLVVKVTPMATSEDAVMFAYGSSGFPSSLHLSAYSASPTTTTTAPTTTTTTSPAPPTTTPAPPPAPPTTTPAPPPAPPTTTPAPPPKTPTPKIVATTTSTTVPATTTTTTGDDPAGVAFPSTTVPPKTPRHQILVLSGSIDAPVDRTVTVDRVRRTALMPTQGLAVVFSTVSETFSLYWEIAIALGLIMSVLLLVGFTNLEIPRVSTDTSERIRRIR